MAKMSDLIEIFIKELFEDTGEEMVEIQRNELASYFKCAPSQINYVLTTRFSMDKGYLIESQRGGGGSIKIAHMEVEKDQYFESLMIEIGESITRLKADQVIRLLEEQETISHREGKIMRAAISDRSIRGPINIKNEIRANILKAMLLSIYDIQSHQG